MAAKVKKRGNWFDFRSGIDVPLAVTALILLVIGMLMLYSASYAQAYANSKSSLGVLKGQIFLGAAGLVVAFFVSGMRTKFFTKLTYPAVGFALALLALSFVSPQPEGKEGFHRWIKIPGTNLTIQPSDFAKVAVIMLFAFLLTRYRDRIKSDRRTRNKFMFLLFGVGLAFSGIVLAENHISGFIIIFALVLLMMYVGGFKEYWLYAILILGAVFFIYCCVNPEAQLFPGKIGEKISDRFIPYIYKDKNLQGDRLQTHQSLIAIGSGGFFGRGFGASRQKYFYLPEPQNDFIFAIVCEELGFVGAVAILALFAYLVYRIYRVSKRATNRYSKLLTIGIAFQIALQVTLNILVVTDTIPNTGIGLPFFSKGGTALLAVLVEIGMVLAVSRENNAERAGIKRNAER